MDEDIPPFSICVFDSHCVKKVLHLPMRSHYNLDITAVVLAERVGASRVVSSKSYITPVIPVLAGM